MPGPPPLPIPPAWVALVTEYLAVQSGAGRSRATLATRRTHLGCLARGLQCTPDQVTDERILAWYGQQTWSADHRRSQRNSAVSFFRWAHRAGHLPTDPGDGLPAMKASAPAPRPVPDDAWLAALESADDRTRLMMRLAAEVGLRRAEIARVHRRDLTVGHMGASLLVHGKGDKLRSLPIRDDLATVIGGAEGYLFPNREGGHLTPSHVGKLIAEALPDGWSAHKLRHRFATRVYRGSRNLLAVQTLLGHSSVATTERYTAVDDAEIRAAMMSALT